MSIRRSGNRMAFTNYSLQRLITWAYDIQDDRLYSKPKWLDSVRYDILANAPQEDPPSTPRTRPSPLQQMMQTLLADRFKLALHRETKELPMYALVVEKNGLKVHLSQAPDVMGQNPFSMPAMGRLIGTQVTTGMLAKALSSQLRRSVEDMTNLQGVFDFKLEWTPDGAEPATGPSLFTALQEQLGFKLEARKGPVEVLVIDRIESAPTEN
jgi:uncharacterized protein (TIGR03435 family)